MDFKKVIDDRDFTYDVWIDGRVYKFYYANDAVEFARCAARHIVKKSWEPTVPEVNVRIVVIEPEEPKPEEEVTCDEKLEEECEA